MAEFPIPEIAATPESQSNKKGQFGVALEPEVIRICAYALGVGFVAGLVAQGLLELIHFFTNLFFYGKFSFAVTSPAHHHLGLWVMLIPPIGGLLVGIMIYFWEPTLKGHGIPEAMESVLFGKSRMRIRVAILRPLATAFAIRTGGPFGAEGPISSDRRGNWIAVRTGGGADAVLSARAAGGGRSGGNGGNIYRADGGNSGGGGVVAVRTAGALVYSGGVRGGGGDGSADSLCGMGAAVFHAGVPADQHDGIVAVCGAGDFDGHRRRDHDSGAGVAGEFLRRSANQARADLVAGDWRFHPGRNWILLPGGVRDQLRHDPRHAERSADRGASGRDFGGEVLGAGDLAGIGNDGGVFAPSLVVGGGLGATYAIGMHHLFPSLVGDPAFYALVAMAAVFGGIARAPLTSIVFLFELSHNPSPLTAAISGSSAFGLWLSSNRKTMLVNGALAIPPNTAAIATSA